MAALQKQSHQVELEEARKSNEILKAALAKAYKDAVFYEGRFQDINDAMIDKHGKRAATDAMIQTKDKLFSDLEKRAGECYSALNALDKSSREDRARAKDDIAELKEKLAMYGARMTSLGESKAVFQQQCQDLLAMLRGKVYPTDFTNAMDHHFGLMIQDNSYLVSVVQGQEQTLQKKDDELNLLRAKARETAGLLEEQKQQCSDLEMASREKDIKLGALQLELDALPGDHQAAMDGKNCTIAGLRKQVRELQDSRMKILDASVDERQRQAMATKDSEIAQLQQARKEHDADRVQLQKARDQHELALSSATEAAAHAQHALAKKSAQLQAALDKLATLDRHIAGQSSLPPTISVLELLEEREARTVRFRDDCHTLESRLRAAKGEAGPATAGRSVETNEQPEELLDGCPKTIGG